MGNGPAGGAPKFVAGNRPAVRCTGSLQTLHASSGVVSHEGSHNGSCRTTERWNMRAGGRWWPATVAPTLESTLSANAVMAFPSWDLKP